jgi:hypothetical protein
VPWVLFCFWARPAPRERINVAVVINAAGVAVAAVVVGAVSVVAVAITVVQR